MTVLVQPDAQSTATKRTPIWLLALLWAGLSVALLYALPNLPWRQAVEHVKGMRAGWIFAALVANVSLLLLWTAEWRLLVARGVRVAFGRMFEVVAITAAVLNSIPFFAGEASAVALLITRGGLSRGAALSLLALDQLLVGIAKLCVIAVAAAYAPLPTWLRAGILSLVFGVAALILVLLPLAHRWSAIRAQLLVQRSAVRDIAARVVSLGAHLDALRDGSRASRVLALSLAKKGAELAAIIAVQIALGGEASFAAGVLVLGALAISTMIPITPGNLGVYEATVFATYRYLGVQAETALALAVVQHIVFLLPMLLIGYLTLTWRQLRPISHG